MEMTTITVKVTEEEKNFLEKIASLENVSLSDYVRTRAIESAEEQMDYLTYLDIMSKQKEEDNVSFEETKAKLGLH